MTCGQNPNNEGHEKRRICMQYSKLVVLYLTVKGVNQESPRQFYTDHLEALSMLYP